jgi:hypothetical protein
VTTNTTAVPRQTTTPSELCLVRLDLRDRALDALEDRRKRLRFGVDLVIERCVLARYELEPFARPVEGLDRRELGLVEPRLCKLEVSLETDAQCLKNWMQNEER